jgi:hypothetical protein
MIVPLPLSCPSTTDVGPICWIIFNLWTEVLLTGGRAIRPAASLLTAAP